MLVLSRSSFLHSIAATASSIAPPVQQMELDLSSAAELINKQCPPEFLRTVALSRRFLYRGEGLQQPMVLSPAPDLLQSDTYGDERAVKYFACLETTLAAQGALARPSTGHIGTSCRADAEVWGAAASVWPVQVSHLAYAWPLYRRAFWEGGVSAPPCERPALRIDAGLERALAQEHEVLFASVSFVAVPAKYDVRLRAALHLRGGAARATAITATARAAAVTTTAAAAAASTGAAGPCGVPVRRIWHDLVGAPGPGGAQLYTLEVDYSSQAGAAASTAQAAALAEHDGLSTCFWPAATPLAALLGSLQLGGTTVHELGAGTGLCSLVAAARGATALASAVEPLSS